QPAGYARKIERRTEQEMQQACFHKADIARPPQVAMLRPLRDRALDTGASRILCFELLRMLARTRRLEGDIVIPFAYQQRAWLRGRSRTLRTTRTRRTPGLTERDLHTGMPMSIATFPPSHTLLSLRTAGLLGIPINHKLGGGKATTGFGLPTGFAGHRP